SSTSAVYWARPVAMGMPSRFGSRSPTDLTADIRSTVTVDIPAPPPPERPGRPRNIHRERRNRHVPRKRCGAPWRFKQRTLLGLLFFTQFGQELLLDLRVLVGDTDVALQLARLHLLAVLEERHHMGV